MYCFLQEYTNLPMMVVYANIKDMLTSVQEVLNSASSRNIRIGTGEMADSLALDEVTGFSQHLVPFFANQKKALLELKTKSTCIKNLLNMDPKGQTVIAWTLSPELYAQKYDLKTASIKERLEAARLCQKAGYKIAFHLDPLIQEPTWKEDYKQLVDELFDQFNLEWVSLGALRFNANLKTIIQRRFPNSFLITGEFVSTPDGKKRYIRSIREEMYETLQGYILQKKTKTPVYLCMESDLVWKNVMGYAPETQEALERYLTGRDSPIKSGNDRGVAK